MIRSTLLLVALSALLLALFWKVSEPRDSVAADWHVRPAPEAPSAEEQEQEAPRAPGRLRVDQSRGPSSRNEK